MKVISINSQAPRARHSKVAGFDAVRAAAALGVVLLHCCVPYMRPEVPGLAWSVRDTPNWLAAQCFWTIELFIMPLFLVLAGCFAWQTLQRSGPASLVRTRSRRLLVPLLFGMVVVLPLDLYAWLLGWVTEGLIPAQKLRSLKFDPAIDRDLWGLSHLWFLQYLFLYVLTLAGMFWAWRRIPSLRRPRPGAGTLAVGLIIVASLVLYQRPEVVWGFQHSFFPVPSKWIYSGVFFALGVLLAAHDRHFVWLKSQATRLVAPALLFAAAALMMGAWHLQGGSNDLASVTLAITTSLGAVLMTFAIIGVAAAKIRSLPSSISYLAAASFWVYMIHHPILGLVHTDLKWMLPSVHPLAKVGLAFLASTALSLVTYELFVRQTALGRLLGFQWQWPGSVAEGTIPLNDTEVISIEAGRPPSQTPDSVPNRRAA